MFKFNEYIKAEVVIVPGICMIKTCLTFDAKFVDYLLHIHLKTNFEP